MKSETAAKLLDLNQQFYQTFALQFSATRHRLQPGVRRFLPGLLASESILDLGCGNGELALELAHEGYTGQYVGFDFSPGLLREAEGSLGQAANISFIQGNLGQAGWELALPQHSFEIVTAFAVLHHLPGDGLRSQVLRGIRECLQPIGSLMISNWQFLNSQRLAGRIQAWETIGLGTDTVDPGDYLLDWRQGGSGLRYVHHFTDLELQALARVTGYTVSDSFLSDGENGKLGLYQIWQPGVCQ